MSIDKELIIEELSRIAVCVLNNLNKIPSADSVIKEIIELLPESPIESYSTIFNKVYEFYLKEGRFQDADCLNDNYTAYFYKIDNLRYSNDTAITFLNELRKFRKINNIKKALDNDDISTIEEIISKDVRITENTDLISIDNIMDAYDELTRSPNGLLTGIAALDHFMQGMDYGTCNVIAAPVSTFKSTMAMSIAYQAAFYSGKKVLYLTLESTPSKIMFNLLVRHAYELGNKISAQSLKKGKLTPEERVYLEEAVEDWKVNCKGRIEIVGTSNLKEYSYAYIEAYMRKMSDTMGGLDLFCLDYLNLLKNKMPANMKLDQYAALNQYTQFFTDLSIRMNFILLLLCQVNRDATQKLDKQAEKEGGKKLASTTFFAEANEVERSATTAMILHATSSMKLSGAVDIFLVKNREGERPENPIPCNVKPQYYKMGSASEYHQPEEALDLYTNLPDSLSIDDIKDSLGNFGAIEDTNDFSSIDVDLNSIVAEDEDGKKA
jgi:replicative DNA helicase